MYELASGNSTRTREEIEADLSHHQNMLAASSTDDITLISKKTNVTKTRSNDIPYQTAATQAYLEASPSRRSKGATLPILQVAHPTQQSYKALYEEKRLSGGYGVAVRSPLEKTQKNEGVIPATDIDTGMPVLVPGGYENLDGNVGRRDHNHKATSSSPTHSRTNRSVPPLENLHTHIHSKSFDSAPTETGSRVSHHHRSGQNSDFNKRTEVSKMKEKFDAIASGHSNDGNQSHSQTSQTSPTSAGHHRNSTENSDSGHESMLETDPTLMMPTATA